MQSSIKECRLREIVEFKGRLNVLGSGLRIGGSRDTAGVGENDNPIIRHPITNLPYVPGSSIKGKLRSLLESKHRPDTARTGEVCRCGECPVCELFGCGYVKNLKSPTRLVFRDCQPSQETRQLWEKTGVSSELKTEVLIDRKKGHARDGGLHTMERIPADSSFDFSFSLRCFEGDDLKAYYEMLAEGFELLEKHYLGGCGSRGYGQVAVVAADGQTMTALLRQKAKES